MKLINEARRLQQLAGILTENEEVGNNGTLRDAFFISGDGDLELDEKTFTNYILSHKNKLKQLWNKAGGNWDKDGIIDDELIKASKLFYDNYPKVYDDFYDVSSNPVKDGNFAKNILLSFDEDMENRWLNIFLSDLNDVIAF